MSFNLALSESDTEDRENKEMGNIFLGAAKGNNGKEVHIWLRKDMRTSETVPCNKCLESEKPV